MFSGPSGMLEPLARPAWAADTLQLEDKRFYLCKSGVEIPPRPKLSILSFLQSQEEDRTFHVGGQSAPTRDSETGPRYQPSRGRCRQGRQHAGGCDSGLSEEATGAQMGGGEGGGQHLPGPLHLHPFREKKTPVPQTALVQATLIPDPRCSSGLLMNNREDPGQGSRWHTPRGLGKNQNEPKSYHQIKPGRGLAGCPTAQEDLVKQLTFSVICSHSAEAPSLSHHLPQATPGRGRWVASTHTAVLFPEAHSPVAAAEQPCQQRHPKLIAVRGWPGGDSGLRT